MRWAKINFELLEFGFLGFAEGTNGDKRLCEFTFTADRTGVFALLRASIWWNNKRNQFAANFIWFSLSTLVIAINTRPAANWSLLPAKQSDFHKSSIRGRLTTKFCYFCSPAARSLHADFRNSKSIKIHSKLSLCRRFGCRKKSRSVEMNCEVRSHNGHMEPAIYCKSFVAKLGNCVCNCKRLANVIFSKHFPSALHKVSKSLESRCNSELSKLMKWSCSKRTSTSFKLNNWFFYVASTVSRFFLLFNFQTKKSWWFKQ